MALMADPPYPTARLALYREWNIFCHNPNLLVGSSPISNGAKTSSTTTADGPPHPSPHPIVPSSVVTFTRPTDLLLIVSCDHPKGTSSGALSWKVSKFLICINFSRPLTFLWDANKQFLFHQPGFFPFLLRLLFNNMLFFPTLEVLRVSCKIYD